jgi:hypothetical protein
VYKRQVYYTSGYCSPKENLIYNMSVKITYPYGTVKSSVGQWIQSQNDEDQASFGLDWVKNSGMPIVDLHAYCELKPEYKNKPKVETPVVTNTTITIKKETDDGESLGKVVEGLYNLLK